MRRRSRGPSRAEVWRAFAEAIGAEAVEGRRGKVSKIRVRHESWVIVLDTFTTYNGHTSQTYTRARAAFRAAEDFGFRVYRRHAFSRLAAVLGMQNIAVGSVALARRFVVKSDSPGRVRSLLSAGALSDRIAKQATLRLEVRRPGRKTRRRLDPDVRLVWVQTTGAVKDPERLGDLLFICRETLDGLRRIGSARTDPVAAIG